MAAGFDHTLGIRYDGTLWASGELAHGAIGDGTPATGSPVLKQIGTGHEWRSAACGIFHSVAVGADGTLWSWGSGTEGQLGNGNTAGNLSPTQVGTDTNWRSVTAGSFHTLATRTDGTLWAWGNGKPGAGVLGTSTSDHTSPTQVGTDTTWQNVAAGAEHSLGEQNCRAVWAWGGNGVSQLGDGTNTTRLVPVPIIAPECPPLSRRRSRSRSEQPRGLRRKRK